jgi:hypothetical protein
VDVLVSGGGGVVGHFHELERLAQTLGGQVSASRKKIVDHGLAPRSIQVGQSGKTVSPKLYLALGINGAVQHVEGLRQVENIISVNLQQERSDLQPVRYCRRRRCSHIHGQAGRKDRTEPAIEKGSDHGLAHVPFSQHIYGLLEDT